ncbi:MAG: protoporphyrinogen/coproporphyrinogen oxidase [Candidatus Sumerlaeota bacterium]
MKIVIIGAGPAGLGAALQLEKSGHHDWEIWEADSQAGGLSRSITDDHGFVWDIGGHVQFSHYRTFDDFMNFAIGRGGWLDHQRESWIRLCVSWVPYPLQYNLHRLPKEWQLRCLRGLVQILRDPLRGKPGDFEELIYAGMGQGLAELFMMPYNYKVWAYPPKMLSTSWIGERVALPDLERILESVIYDRDDVAWGPNSTFRFPEHGGTGAVWQALADRLPHDKLHYHRRVARIDAEGRQVESDSGDKVEYDALISTMPLDNLVKCCGLEHLQDAADMLQCSSVHVVGVGLDGKPGADLASKCWMYFPEDNCPFFRVTVFSNYSPNNVPDINKQWSLMAEVSQSPEKPVDESRMVEDVLQGLVNAGLIANRKSISHTFHLHVDHAYPTPGLKRDEALARLLPSLEAKGIYSRGRMGAWKYEVGNMDHSMMQGIEAANHILHGFPELTLWFPDQVNRMHPVYGKDWL